VDSSGIRITYTPTLRDNDVGMLQMGSVYGIFVPPKVEEFDVIAYCHSSCTEQVGTVTTSLGSAVLALIYVFWFQLCKLKFLFLKNTLKC